MTATETALAAFGVLAIHSVAYYVWVAVHAPRYVPGHETTIAPMEGEQR